MTRVAQIMAGAAEGGAELFFERLCIGLHQAGETVLPVIRANPARAATLTAAGLAPQTLAFGPPVDLLTRPRLRATLRRFAPDVAVFWMNRANQHAPRGDFVSVGRLGGYYDLKYYRGRDHLVGNTRGIVAWLRRQGWAAGRTHYLPNFVEDFAATPPADRSALGFAPHQRLLLGLGRLHTDKGFDTLIRALPRIPRASLAIAGAGPEAAALAELARREGVAERMQFLGWRRDAGALLRAADVFVCSSRIEPLGNMVLEAWSAGTPVVAVAADGPRELIADGADGLLAPHEDPAALAAAITGLLDDPSRAASLAAAGRARYATEFAAAPVLARWRAFLSAIAP
jgi:glycosyltransferase involved in cell wall biosynthesis